MIMGIMLRPWYWPHTLTPGVPVREGSMILGIKVRPWYRSHVTAWEQPQLGNNHSSQQGQKYPPQKEADNQKPLDSECTSTLLFLWKGGLAAGGVLRVPLFLYSLMTFFCLLFAISIKTRGKSLCSQCTSWLLVLWKWRTGCRWCTEGASLSFFLSLISLFFLVL